MYSKELEKSVALAKLNPEWTVVDHGNNHYGVFNILIQQLFVLTPDLNFFTVTPIDGRRFGEPHFMYYANDLVRALMNHGIDGCSEFLSWAKNSVINDDGWDAHLWSLYPAEAQHLILNKALELFAPKVEGEA